MCQLPIALWPALWLPLYSLCLATAWVSGRRGRWLQIELDRQNAIAETARIAAQAETRRGAAQQQARDRAKTRVKVIEREYAKLPAGCEFGDDEFRLLNAERDALMGTGPSTLPGAVSGDAAVSKSARQTA